MYRSKIIDDINSNTDLNKILDIILNTLSINKTLIPGVQAIGKSTNNIYIYVKTKQHFKMVWKKLEDLISIEEKEFIKVKVIGNINIKDCVF